MRAGVLAAAAIAGSLVATGVAQAAAPRVTVTLSGNKVRATTSAAFKISRTPSTAKLTCRLDAGAWAPCTTTKIVTRLANGRHTLAVRATSGRTVASASAQVVVDTLAPHTPQIANQSGGWTNAAFKTVVATSVTDVGLAGGVSYEYRIAGWNARCGLYGTAHAITGRTLNVDQIGAHCVEFRAKDAVGNLSGWSGSYVVLIDRAAPGQAVVTGADGSWHKTLTLTAAAADATSGIGHYQWYTSTNGGETWTALPIAWGKATMTFSTTGSVLARTVAVDNAGNEGGSSSAVVINIDRTSPTAPTLTVANAGGWSNDNLIHAAGSIDSDSGVDHYSCYDGATLLGSTADADSPLALTDGQYELVCKAVDQAGNIGPASDEEDVMIDTVGPVIDHADGDMGDATTSQSVTLFQPDATDAGSGLDHVEYQVSEDGGVSWEDWDTCQGCGLNFMWDGTFAVRYRAVDVAGNVGAVSNVVRVNIVGLG